IYSSCTTDTGGEVRRFCASLEFARAESRHMSRIGLRQLAKLGMMGLPALGLACSQVHVAQPRALPSPMLLEPSSPVDPAMGITQTETGSTTIRAQGAEAKPGEKQTLPISLDIVLRLAAEQNPQIAVASAKVSAACAEKEAARARWLP